MTSSLSVEYKSNMFIFSGLNQKTILEIQFNINDENKNQ